MIDDLVPSQLKGMISSFDFNVVFGDASFTLKTRRFGAPFFFDVDMENNQKDSPPVFRKMVFFDMLDLHPQPRMKSSAPRILIF